MQRFTFRTRLELGKDGLAGVVIVDVDLPDLAGATWRDRRLLANIIRNVAAYAQGPDIDPALEAELVPDVATTALADEVATLDPEDPDRACRVCGCTEERACVSEGRPCRWVEVDLCSACSAVVDSVVASAEAAELDVDDIFGDDDRVPAEDTLAGEAYPADIAEPSADELAVLEAEADTVVAEVATELVTAAVDAAVETATIGEPDPEPVVPTKPVALFDTVAVERAAMRLTALERLNPGVALARELGIPGNRVGPYVRMARARGYLPQTQASLDEER